MKFLLSHDHNDTISSAGSQETQTYHSSQAGLALVRALHDPVLDDLDNLWRTGSRDKQSRVSRRPPAQQQAQSTPSAARGGRRAWSFSGSKSISWYTPSIGVNVLSELDAASTWGERRAAAKRELVSGERALRRR